MAICPCSDLIELENFTDTSGITKEIVARAHRSVGFIRVADGLDLNTLYGGYRRRLANGQIVRNPINYGNVSHLCTGAVIGPNLFLTAGHCFRDYRKHLHNLPRRDGNVPVQPAEIAQHMEIVLEDTSGDLPEYITYPVEAVLAYDFAAHEDDDWFQMDYAILRLSGHPERRFGMLEIASYYAPELLSSDGSQRRSIAILQYPALADAAQLPKKTVAVGTPAGSDFAGGMISDKLRYKISTVGGSSGSPIIDPQGYLVGMHQDNESDNDTLCNDNYLNFGAAITAILREALFTRASFY